MNLVYEGVDISTEEKFARFVDSLNEEILSSRGINNQDKPKTLNKAYLMKRYRSIIARVKQRTYMAENNCQQCLYFQRLARMCNANCQCELENITRVKGGDYGC